VSPGPFDVFWSQSPTVTAQPQPAPVDAPQAEPKEIPMSTVPAVPAPPSPTGGVVAPTPKPNGFVSFLKVIGSDAKKVLAFLASPKNQAIVVATENAGAAIVGAIDPALTAPIASFMPLIQNWTAEIFKAEALGAAAIGVDPAATDIQKSAAVISALAPQVIAFAEANKLPIPTGDRMQAANDALVAFFDAFEGPATPTA
jgi:hypothetical protein